MNVQMIIHAGESLQNPKVGPPKEIHE